MRDARGRLQPGWRGSSIERFLRNCRHDPGSGCVIWTGGQTSGRGHSSPYGAFWDDGRAWTAHRWSARNIHGFSIDGLQVDHWCPNIPYPDTLCVEHVRPMPGVFNRELQTIRNQPVTQSLLERKRWIYVQVGLEPPPPSHEERWQDVPFFEPPTWMESRV